MTFKELQEQVLKILPNASFEKDDHGQVIIYTNLRETSEDGALEDIYDEILGKKEIPVILDGKQIGATYDCGEPGCCRSFDDED